MGGEPDLRLSSCSWRRRRQLIIGIGIAIPVEAYDSTEWDDAHPRACRPDGAQQHESGGGFSDLIQLQQRLEPPQERSRIRRRVSLVVRIEARCNQLDVVCLLKTRDQWIGHIAPRSFILSQEVHGSARQARLGPSPGHLGRLARLPAQASRGFTYVTSAPISRLGARLRHAPDARSYRCHSASLR